MKYLASYGNLPTAAARFLAATPFLAATVYAVARLVELVNGLGLN